MAAPKIFQPHPVLKRLIGPLANRPRLASAFAVGIAVAVALALAPTHLRWSTQAVFAWDAVCAWFIGTTLLMMAECDDAKLRARAATQDEGQHFVLILAVIASAASIVAIAAELSLAKSDHGLIKGLRVGLAFVTVAASWVFVQIIFALHYAHEYYFESDGGRGRRRRGGLLFPEDDTPDYWDFLHFAMIIGVAAQTADVAFTAKALRRTGTWHGVVSFLFNTVVLALTINLLAGLF